MLTKQKPKDDEMYCPYCKEAIEGIHWREEALTERMYAYFLVCHCCRCILGTHVKFIQ